VLRTETRTGDVNIFIYIRGKLEVKGMIKNNQERL
jgi:hypothetical protein